LKPAAIVVMILALSGCSARAPNLSGMTADQVFARGLERLEARKWEDARMAFEQFTLSFPTDPRYGEARFRLGDAYFGKRDYEIAALEYLRLSAELPSHELADDARFRVCEAYDRLSPKSQLHQEYTTSAIDHCTALLTYHPDTEYAEQARVIITALREKLAKKKYEPGELYRRTLEADDSAILVFQDLLAEFPETAYAPRALLRLYQIYVSLNYADEAAEARGRLLREYPESEEARELGGSAFFLP
jgi:outer membrane assembly lipoprotein YfiO